VTFGEIDAAFYWKANNKVYFFSGNQYVRYDVSTERVDDGYPMYISSNWGKGNMFPSVDAALPWGDDKVYFHTDGQKVKKSKKSTIFELEQNKEKNARFTLR